jgi:hypothetical protein
MMGMLTHMMGMLTHMMGMLKNLPHDENADSSAT